MPIVVENVVATTSNMQNGTIFWSDMKLKKISRLDRGSEPQVVSNHFIYSSMYLAIAVGYV